MKAIILDLYNTLVYTKDRKSPYADFFGSLGLTKVEAKQWIDKVLTNEYPSFKEILEEIRPNLNIYIDKYDYQVKEEVRNTFVYEDTYSTLSRLKRKYQLFLLSNISTPYIQSYYDLGLDKYIETPFFSSQIGFRKPDPKAFEFVLDSIGMDSSQVIMIGDSLRSDFQGAQNVGIKAILKDKPLSIITQDLV